MQTQRQKKTRNGSENNIFRVSFLDGQLGITKIKYTNIHLKVIKIYILRNHWGEIARGLQMICDYATFVSNITTVKVITEGGGG